MFLVPMTRCSSILDRSLDRLFDESFDRFIVPGRAQQDAAAVAVDVVIRERDLRILLAGVIDHVDHLFVEAHHHRLLVGLEPRRLDHEAAVEPVRDRDHHRQLDQRLPGFPLRVGTLERLARGRDQARVQRRLGVVDPGGVEEEHLGPGKVFDPEDPMPGGLRAR